MGFLIRRSRHSLLDSKSGLIWKAEWHNLIFESGTGRKPEPRAIVIIAPMGWHREKRHGDI
ncbi:MAG: hypothetical protein QOH35_3546 [Acidobacteriaceae bacterium]|nr:hypothetical protein [Acidobacteriaceae bacterium]